MFHFLFIGTNLSLTSSVVAWKLIAKRQPISFPTDSILGTTPEVERVILFLEIDIPVSSIMIASEMSINL